MRVNFPESVLGAGGESPPPDGEVIELALLLPTGQVTALERAARGEGLTLGRMVRRLIRDFLALPTATVSGGEASRPRIPHERRTSRSGFPDSAPCRGGEKDEAPTAPGAVARTTAARA